MFKALHLPKFQLHLYQQFNFRSIYSGNIVHKITTFQQFYNYKLIFDKG